MTELPAEKQAEKAIIHTLRRISEHTTVAYHCGYGTQVYSLLTESLATLTGKTIDEVQDCFPPAQPKELEEGDKRDCPFCGGHYLQMVESYGDHHVHCGDCRFNGPEGDTEEDAVTKWNERSIQRL